MSDSEIMVVENPTTTHNSLDLIKDSKTLETENNQAALVVKQVLHNKPNPVMVNGKRHLEFEDWIALGNTYGITVKTHAEPVEIFEAKGFKGFADVIRVADGVIIGGAESYCLDDESKWQNKEYFQMSSMAQTRAGSKALSNALRGVVALDKSLNGTPGEEMGNIPKNVPRKPPQPTPQKPVKAPKAPKPSKDDEAIEVEAEVITENKPGANMSLKDMIDNNKMIRLAVDELQATEAPVNRATIQDKLLDFVDMGKITTDEYKEAKALLE